ncbi:MAG: hypothetical protein EZS28_015358 [Streblomastix strix]|uniref:Uncharacterized protein n=1 Tax=Streblomastix strix TaxID=222440 RepID=A0A5J4W2I6_9EUKA|nr:MAG: hypothetical protein EZS28_015358 [Streblomastix strix]
MAKGPVNRKQGKYSRMGDTIKQNEVQSQKDPPRIDIPEQISEPHKLTQEIFHWSSKTQLSDLPKNLKQIMEDDADNYTQLENEFTYSKGCEVYVDERDGEVSVRFRGQAKTIVRKNGHFEPNTDEELHYNFWEVESPEDMKIWTACILADAAQIKSSHLNEAVLSQQQYATFRDNKRPNSDAFVPPKMIPVKRKRDKSQPVGKINSNSLQAQFQQQRQQQSKFNSLAYQKVAQDLVTIFEGVLRKQASKIDMLSQMLEQVARQKLFEEISWDAANIIIPIPEVGLLLKEEGPGYARKSLESAVAVTQGMVMLISNAVKNETNNLVGNMLKIFEASLVSVADSQIKRESRLEGVYQGPQTEDVLSLQTKEKFKKKTGKQINIGGRKFGNIFTRYNSLNRGRKRQNRRSFGFKPRAGLYRELKRKSFKFNNYSNHTDDKNSP